MVSLYWEMSCSAESFEPPACRAAGLFLGRPKTMEKVLIVCLHGAELSFEPLDGLIDLSQNVVPAEE